ncbi:MAG TPA: flagellar biosynthesis protein FliQ [Planctomycetes bacterium]|nr:flagellar biosynthesis protein FliQ [Planctomycetota bacterium]HIN79451.1 flagellar biosynthesis protein FliQ [Planctomycetota bacterium]
MEMMDLVVEALQASLWAVLKLSLPLLLVGLVVGLLVTLFQAVTQIQDPTLTFVPKIVAVALAMILLLPLLLSWSLDYTRETFQMIGDLWGGR